MLRKLFTILLFISSIPVFAQINFQFIPELHGRNIDGLMNVRVLNVSGPKTVTLTLTVIERKQGKVLSLKTQPFTLTNGNNVIPASATRGARIQFGNNLISTTTEENGYFPEGDYEYCFTLNSTSDGQNGGVPIEQCFPYELVPTAPLSLIEPYNKDKICEKRPLLSWQPSFPQIPGAAYQLVLAEIKERQNATEALNYNLPIISQAGINTPIIPYPSSAKELTAGKRYAWQVSVYKNQTVLNRSEVWEFTVDCGDTVENTVLADNGYRDIEDLLKGNYYVAEGELKYVVINSYKEQTLKYEIQCLTDPSLKIKRLPSVKLLAGKNKININLTNNRAFKDSYYYIMKVWLPNGSQKDLRFVYREAL